MRIKDEERGNMRHHNETLRIIDVGPNRINRLNDRFAKYLLAGPKSKPVLIDFINGVLLLDGTDRIVGLCAMRKSSKAVCFTHR
jgi:hypothetical protein